jgi:hypothetical protein
MTHHARSSARRFTFARATEPIVKFMTSRMSFPGVDAIERTFWAPYHDDSPMMQASAKSEPDDSETSYFLASYPDCESMLTFDHPHDVLTEYMNYVVSDKGNPQWFHVYYVPARSTCGFPITIEWDGPTSGTMPRFTDESLRKICALR